MQQRFCRSLISGKMENKNRKFLCLFLTSVFTSVLAAFFALLLFGGNSPLYAAEKERLFIGTYTGAENASEGIYTATLDAQTGELSEPVLAAKCDNPAFLAIHPTKSRLYAISESDKSKLLAFSINRTNGQLTLLDERELPGKGSCHLAICTADDSDFDAIVVANYTSGNIVSVPVFESGKLGKIASSIPHLGKGPNTSRQNEPHPHGAYFNQQDKITVAVPDLGIDKVMMYEINLNSGALSPKFTCPFLLLPPGGGPRHLCCSSNNRFIYVNNELTSTVSVFDMGEIMPNSDEKNDPTEKISAKKPPMIQNISTLPDDFDPSKNSTAEIFLSTNERFLYVSNRGHNSIAVFSVDADSGKLNLIETTSCGGDHPRFFGFDPTGKFLISCNMRTNNMVVFNVDQENGKLTRTEHEKELSKPVCFVFVP
ncbi:MAG: lactonase family protein [Thermoguttaceae bacterium]